MQSTSAEPIFYPVSIRKFTLMMISTFSFYLYFWAYRNYRWLQETSGTRHFPVLSALFLTITLFSLIQKVNEIGAKHGQSGNLPATTLAILFFVFNMLGALPGALGFLCTLAFFVIAIVQRRINKINLAADPPRPVDDHLGVFHWLFIVPAIAIEFFLLLGTLLAPEVFVSP